MEIIRRRKREQIVGYIIFFSIGAVIFLIFCLAPFAAKSYQTWDNLDFNSDLSYVYVTEIEPDIEGPYYTTKDDNGLDEEFYYVAVDESHVMSLIFLEYDVVELAQKYSRAKQDFKEGNISKKELDTYRFTVIGRIQKANEYDRHEDLRAYLSHQESADSDQIEILPYSMQVITKASRNMYLCGMGGFVLFCMAAIAGCILWTGSSLGERMIVKYRKGQGDTQSLREKINSFFRLEEFVPNLWLNKEFIGGIYNTITVFGETKQIAWVYPIIFQYEHSVGGIKVYFKNGRNYDLRLQNEVDVETVLQYLRAYCPWIVTEYSDDLQEKYKKGSILFKIEE
ncbi:MAG: hypothetical protein K2J90_02360 [Lachnospiraceae bacterium]|nr:hypothetical protein [Lachnospiraceae bacterium]